MNNQDWINDIQWQDVQGPQTDISQEEVYTLKMGDFLAMPDVNFQEMMELDPALRALMN